jgi:hypothetical protein
MSNTLIKIFFYIHFFFVSRANKYKSFLNTISLYTLNNQNIFHKIQTPASSAILGYRIGREHLRSCSALQDKLSDIDNFENMTKTEKKSVCYGLALSMMP